jgi:hypothetical protein
MSLLPAVLHGQHRVIEPGERVQVVVVGAAVEQSVPARQGAIMSQLALQFKGNVESLPLAGGHALRIQHRRPARREAPLPPEGQ